MERELECIFNPRSVAVVGASHDPIKWGHLMSKGLIEGGYSGDIYLINPKGGTLFRRECYKSVFDVKGPVDLAVIGIPSGFVLDSVKELIEKRVKGIIIVTAGFGETGEEGRRIQDEVIKAARRAGVRVVGPNCLGFYNSSINLNTTLLSFKEGHLAFLTQSGNFGLEINYLAQKRGLGFSKFVSYGNQADILLHEYLAYVKDDPDTKAVLLYIEGLKNGCEFFKIAGETSKNKPVVALKVGTTSAGIRSAASHTGSLAGSYEIYQAAFKQAGIITVSNSHDLLDVAEALTKCPLPKGNRIAILADGGGHATMGADAAERCGLEVPVLSKETQDKLAEIMPRQSSKKNPVDFAGGAEADLWSFVKCSEILLQDNQIDGLMIVGQYGGYQDLFPDYGNLEEEVSLGISQLVKKYNKPVIVHTMYLGDNPKSLQVLSSQDVPVYGIVETAMRCMAALVEYRKYLDTAGEGNSADSGAAPVPKAEAGRVNKILEDVKSSGRANLLETEAREVLKGYGFPVSEFKLAGSRREAVKIAGDMGYPVAMKIVSPDIVHKSDTGGVMLNLKSGEEVKRAFDQIVANAKSYNPRSEIHGVIVTPMERPGKEVIIGMTRDETFGPTIMFGMGGIFVEVLKDVSFRVAPVTKEEGRRMIAEIKGLPLLLDFRGSLKSDIDALAGLIAKLSLLAIQNPDIKEIDLNPVFVFNQGCSVVDARIII